MTFAPDPRDSGFALLKVAIRDYLVHCGITASIIDEGRLTEELFLQATEPIIILSKVGDGASADPNRTLFRMLLYVTIAGRDLYSSEELAMSVRKYLNSTQTILDYLILDPAQGYPIIEHVSCRGSGASTTLPTWKAEAIPLYVFVRGIGGGFQPEWS